MVLNTLVQELFKSKCQDSKNTARRYRADYEMLFRWWVADHPGRESKTRTDMIKELTHDDVMRFLRWGREEKHWADGTVTTKLGAYNSIFGMLADLAYLPRNVFRAARYSVSRRAHAKRRETFCFSWRKVPAICEMPDLRTPDGISDSAMLYLLFYGCFRRSEVVSINCGDVLVTPDGRMQVSLQDTKSGQGCTKELAPMAAEAVSRLISLRKTEGAGFADALLVVRRGHAYRRMSDKTLYRHYRAYTGQAPHSARATAVTELLNRTQGNLDLARRLLGHRASIRTVDAYDKRRVEELRRPGGILACLYVFLLLSC